MISVNQARVTAFRPSLVQYHPALLFALLTVLLFALQQHILDLSIAAEHYHPHARLPRWVFHRLPTPVLFWEFSTSRPLHICYMMLGIAQTVVLIGLYRSLRRVPNAPTVAVLIALAVVMTMLALFAATMTSSDAYSYIAYAKLGLHHAYRPPSGALPGNLHLLNGILGEPLLPCFYGPLWVLIAQTISGWVTTLTEGLYVWRSAGLISFVMLLALLRKRNCSGSMLAVAAFNPALLTLFVTNAHNDLLGIDFVIGAIIVAQRFPLAAMVLTACGGLIKLPLVALALLVFSGADRRRSRIVYVGTTVVLVVVASTLLAGMHYFPDLFLRLHTFNGEHGAAKIRGDIIRRALLALCALSLALAFVYGRFFRGASWTFIGLSTLVIAPWYVIWGLPYALFSRQALAEYCLLLPAIAAILEQAFSGVPLRSPELVLMAAYAAYSIIRGNLSAQRRGNLGTVAWTP